jgi:hypothetical protein
MPRKKRQCQQGPLPLASLDVEQLLNSPPAKKNKKSKSTAASSTAARTTAAQSTTGASTVAPTSTTPTTTAAPSITAASTTAAACTTTTPSTTVASTATPATAAPTTTPTAGTTKKKRLTPLERAGTVLLLCYADMAADERIEQNAAALPRPPDDYVPLKPQFPPHDAYNILPRSLTEDPFELTPDAIFALFFTKELMEMIVRNTNLYAIYQGAAKTQGKAGQGRSWTPMILEDLKVWLGISILMGVTREPAVKDYWRSNDGCNSQHPFTEFMDLVDFEQIKRYLHVSEPEPLTGCLTPENENKKEDLWFHKIAPLLDHLGVVSRQHRTLGTHVSVDEAMVLYTGRTYHKYFMRNKPISEGYKLFALAERGYVYAIYPETPVHRLRAPLDVPNHPGNLTHTSDVVIHLLNTLPRDKHHFNVAMDNYFVDPRLFRYLRDEFKMGAYGTLRGGVLKDSSIDVPAQTALPYHFLTGEIVDRDILSFLWMDNGPVKMLSTIHEVVGENALTVKLRKLPSSRRCQAPEESVQKVGVTL